MRSLGAVAIFLIAAFSLFFVEVQGQLYISEILLAGIALVSVLDRRRPRYGLAIGVTLLIWLYGTVLSDLAADSDTIDAVKGVLRVLFLFLDFFALWYLVRRRTSSLQILWWGMVAAQVISFVLYPNAAARGEPWKFGLGIAVTTAVVLLLSRVPRSKLASVTVFLALAGLHFSLGFRSMSVICLIVALVFFFRQTGSRGIGVRLRTLTLATLGVAAVVLLTTAYDRLALAGAFGFQASQKAQYQSAGYFGSLFSGRSEVLLSLNTISQRPLLGGGSYSVASSDIATSTASLFDNWGYTSIAHVLSAGAPAYHSELLGSWAENGIAAVPFWLLVSGLLVGGVVAVMRGTTRHPELVAFLSVLGLWDVLFSPFGADRRFWLAATLVAVVVCRVAPEQEPGGDRPAPSGDAVVRGPNSPGVRGLVEGVPGVARGLR